VSDTILTPEQVRSERYRYPDSTTEDGANDVIALGDSHETLRSRLAEAEAMRDRADEHVEAVVEALRDREHDVHHAEAALAEAVELLRRCSAAFSPLIPTDPDELRARMLRDAEAVRDARAFIEAHRSSQAG
jgi:DNA-binding SARP family transcriptional activator